MAEKKRLLWVDQIKGIAFFLVTLGHASGINRTFHSYLYSFHMPLFFMVTGLNLNIDRIYETPFTSYFSKMFKRMIVPYVWLNFFSLTIRYFTSVFITHKPLNVVNFLRGIIVANTAIDSSPSPATPTYYIVLLFLAQLLLWLIIRLAKKDYFKIGLISVCLVAISIATQRVNIIWHINVVPTAVLLIFTGKLLMEFYRNNKQKIESLSALKYAGVCALLFAAGVVLWHFNGKVSIHLNLYGEDYVLFMLGALVSSIAIALITMKLPDTKIFSFVGKNTLFYLGIHAALLSMVECIFPEYKKDLWFIIFETVAVYLVLVPVTHLANKFIPWANGNVTTKNTIITKCFGFLSVAAAGFVPCNYFINNFAGGILESSTTMRILSIAGYLVICTAVYFVFGKLTKFMFILEERKAEK